MSVKLLVVDDHPITRAGVRTILEADDTFEIIGEAKDGLDEEHNDLRIFLVYLTEALEKIIPGCLQETGKAISGVELPPFKDLSYILFNDLCDIDEELILVLDDYHKINNERIHKLLDEWLCFPPPNVHLSIITRRDPPMDEINSLRLSGRMTEIRMGTLSFTNDEIVRLFKQLVNIDLSDSAIQMLHDKTEGWIIALRLASMIIGSAEDLDRVLQAVEGGLNTISDYLIAEILSKQPEQIREPNYTSPEEMKSYLKYREILLLNE